MSQTSRLAVVTGASSRIGEAISKSLAQAGYGLALLGQDAGRLAATRTDCETAGTQARTYAFDLTSEAETDAALVHLNETQGQPGVLVHAAGIFDCASPADADGATWTRLVDLNLTAVMRLTHKLLPGLARPGRAVILIGSGAGYQGFANNAAYVASKHGVVGFGRALFQDLRDKGTKVSVVSPGLVAAGASLAIDEKLHHRFLRPEDVADAVRYVLSTAPSACPTEIILQPQLTPTRDDDTKLSP